MSDQFLPYARHWVTEEDVEAVCEVLRGDWLTTGPAVERFERGLAEFTGTRFCSVLNSGTAGLHAAYFAAGLEPGDEIVTTPLTFAATANAALMLGARVHFADVDPRTGLISPSSVEEKITSKTRFIVPVDYSGHPADYSSLGELAEANSIKIVADACHSLGATYREKKVGTLADLSVLSFHPAKAVTTGEGGGVVTDCENMDQMVRNFRNHGLITDPQDFERNEGPWHQELQYLGCNYRISDIQCALGTSQLARLDSWLVRRREIALAYSGALDSCKGLLLPVEEEYVHSAWHLYVIRVAGDPGRRNVLFEKLREFGIGVQVHYLPVHHHPYYRRIGYDPQECPEAVEFSSRALSLPLFPAMTDDDVDRVVAKVNQAVKEVL